MEGTYLNDRGERVIPASRRPDGTYRKEVRVKAGYIPQDEQPVYMSRGALARQGVPRVPGMDDGARCAEVEQAKSVAKSKAARKNEKRKQKKSDTVTDISPAVTDISTASRKQTDSLASHLEEGLRLNGAEDEISAPGAESTFSAADKNARALRKKLKQVDALLKRQQAGDILTGPELEKVGKASEWRAELEELEHCRGQEISLQ